MEAPKTALDQETWLTLFAPGAILAAAVYVAYGGQMRWPEKGLPGEVQAVLALFVSVALSCVLGVLNAFVARRLYNLHWPWGWPEGWWNVPWLHPTPLAMARREFSGEMLPYTALAPDVYKYERILPFHQRLAERVRQVAGDDSGPECSLRARGRHPHDVASDVIKAWVVAKVEKGVSRDAWEYAARFRQLGDAYTNLSVAVSVSLVLVTSAGPLSAVFAGWRLVAVVAVAVTILLTCQRQAVNYWIQWQGELCRIFYAAQERQQ